MQFSLARNGVAALHLATSVFLTGNHKGGFKGDFYAQPKLVEPSDLCWL